MIGEASDNPILSTAIYHVESPDGKIEEYTANVIAGNLFSNVDDDGYNFDYLYERIGHRKDEAAISKDKGFIETKFGVKRRVITIKGWQF